jgi:predicted O-methyltransferase YrrM
VVAAVAGLALLGALWALIVEHSVALAVVIGLQMALTGATLLIWRRLGRLERSDRSVQQKLEEVGVSIHRLATEVKDGAVAQPLLDAFGIERLDAAARERELGARIAEGVRQSAADTAALLNLFTLVRVEQEVPPPDGWALQAETLLAMVGHVLSERPTTVVECGSGTSTVWLAYALRQVGSGRLVALEHDEHYAEVTQQALVRNGLQDWADVRIAPLESVRAGGEEHKWYARAAWEDLTKIDLVLVDGPPGHVANHARYPAFPSLAAALAPNATVVLDDVNRPQEQAVLDRWTREPVAGRRLSRQRDLGRSTFLVVSAAPQEVAGSAPSPADQPS